MFQFPRFPLPSLCVQLGVPGYHPRGVAPFGHPRIIACPRLPEAFRCLATSFFGPRCQGIHRVPFARIRLLSPIPRTSTAQRTPRPVSHTQHISQAQNTVVSGVYRATSLPKLCRHNSVRQRPTTPRFRCVCLFFFNASPRPSLVKVTGGAAGTRTPDLRLAKAALSRLSYSPVVVAAGGRSWT